MGESVSTQVKSSRLMSLDVMRGLDMFFLVVVGPILSVWQAQFGLPTWLATQLRHVNWEGLTAWDLIMPWFIFMCGAAIPFALPKRLENGRARWRYWGHVIGRVALLWVLGMVVQGNLLSLRFASMQVYNNTLQAIAAGYLIAAVVFLIPNKLVRYLIPLLMAAGYGLALAIGGDYTQNGNFAICVERWVFPANHDGYGWVLTTLMFGVMTLCGMGCTELLKSDKCAFRKLLLLSLLGGGLLGGGLLLGVWEPAIKRIYTVSFTAQALGWGVLMLSLLYGVIDLLRITRGWGVLTLYGRHALTAYLCGTVFWQVLRSAAHTVGYGLGNWVTPPVYAVIQVTIATFILTFILWIVEHLRVRG